MEQVGPNRWKPEMEFLLFLTRIIKPYQSKKIMQKKKKNCFPNDEKDHILCLLNGILKWLRLLSSSKEVDSFQLQHDCITLKKPSLDGHTSNQQVNTFITSFPPYLLMCSFHASCNTSNDLESKSFLGQCKEWDED